MNLVVKDAVRQIAGRVVSAIGGFLVIKFITPYLGPLRFGDYSTILKYFAIWSAFADFGVYVIALKELGVLKKKQESGIKNQEGQGRMNNKELIVNSEQGIVDGNTIIDTSDHHAELVEHPRVLARSTHVRSHDHLIDEFTATLSTTTLTDTLSTTYSKFVTTRFLMIIAVYVSALVIAYLIPAYSSNPYLIWGLPLGMLFSASFMSSGILQLPLQLFRKMEHVSIALILARVSQLAVIAGTIYRWYTSPGFADGDGQMAFVMIVGSVLVSGLIQMLYTIYQGEKYLGFRWSLDRTFVQRIIGGNWQYGVAYYLSSFHTLLVLMVLSRLYPTTEGFTYVGVWALALSLIEILLIVPSALGNSMIHDVSGSDRQTQQSRYSALLRLVVWIGCFVMIMGTIFAPHVIYFMGGSDFLTSASQIGSDTILPFLTIVLVLSFVRQVHNYLFVTTGHQNTLLSINLVGVTIGLAVGLPLIIQYGLRGGIATQILLEVLFVGGSLWVAYRESISLRVPWKMLVGGVVLMILLLVYIAPLTAPYTTDALLRIPIVFVLTGLIVGVSYPFLRKTLRQLS